MSGDAGKAKKRIETNTNESLQEIPVLPSILPADGMDIVEDSASSSNVMIDGDILFDNERTNAASYCVFNNVGGSSSDTAIKTGLAYFALPSFSNISFPKRFIEALPGISISGSSNQLRMPVNRIQSISDAHTSPRLMITSKNNLFEQIQGYQSTPYFTCGKSLGGTLQNSQLEKVNKETASPRILDKMGIDLFSINPELIPPFIRRILQYHQTWRVIKTDSESERDSMPLKLLVEQSKKNKRRARQQMETRSSKPSARNVKRKTRTNKSHDRRRTPLNNSDSTDSWSSCSSSSYSSESSDTVESSKRPQRQRLHRASFKSKEDYMAAVQTYLLNNLRVNEADIISDSSSSSESIDDLDDEFLHLHQTELEKRNNLRNSALNETQRFLNQDIGSVISSGLALMNEKLPASSHQKASNKLSISFGSRSIELRSGNGSRRGYIICTDISEETSSESEDTDEGYEVESIEIETQGECDAEEMSNLLGEDDGDSDDCIGYIVTEEDDPDLSEERASSYEVIELNGSPSDIDQMIDLEREIENILNEACLNIQEWKENEDVLPLPISTENVSLFYKLRQDETDFLEVEQ